MKDKVCVPVLVRTCVVCRGKYTKRDLVRFVWYGDRPKRDVSQKMLGRGAYCCSRSRCIEKFQRMERKWKRIFKR